VDRKRVDDDLDRIVDVVPWELHEPPRRVA